MNPPIRILLVDDHAIVREGVRALCAAADDIEVVGEAANGAEALAMLARLPVDVAIVDLKMPGMPTVQLVEQMQRIAPPEDSDGRSQVDPSSSEPRGWPLCNIIIFTSYAEDQALREVTQAGAIGYLLKDVQRQELLAAIRAVAAGRPWLQQSMHAQVVALLRRKPSTDPYAHLSPRERSVLKLLGEGLSNRRIGEELALTEGTVKGYVSNLLRKLRLNQRTQAALLVTRQPVADLL